MNNSCIIKLPEFSYEHSEGNNQIFFVESFNKSSIRGRWACALESAINFSNLPVKVIMTSAVLNLAKPLFRNLFNQFYSHKTIFFTIDAEKLLSNTPIEGMLQVLNATNTYKSDLMRAALLYKYGGFHLDFDALTRSDLSRIRNSIGLEGFTLPSFKCQLEFSQQKTMFDTNGVMQFNKGNPSIKI